MICVIRTYHILVVLAGRILSNHWIATTIRVQVKDGWLTAKSRLHVILLQVLIHNRCIGTLRKLPSLLDATVAENATAHLHFSGADLLKFGLRLSRHLELLDGRFGEFRLDFLLKVY